MRENAECFKEEFQQSVKPPLLANKRQQGPGLQTIIDVDPGLLEISQPPQLGRIESLRAKPACLYLTSAYNDDGWLVAPERHGREHLDLANSGRCVRRCACPSRPP